MAIIRTSDLDAFVRDVDDHGGNPHHPELLRKYHPFELRPDFTVDQSLDPFSPEYFRQQIALYEEITGRTLDQETGELHPSDIEHLFTEPNPLGIRDTGHIAEHLRALSTILSLSCLGTSPRVLDMGAGHGVSSEMFAFAGCSVHAVDIDPVLGQLSRRRAAVRNLDITRNEGNYDDLGFLPDGAYAAAFFFQSLHHCLRPWELIGALAEKLAPDGVIAFAGEPIQSIWWKHWGLRLDQESLYVARALGWFESGWSQSFIRDCFARNGMRLSLFSGGNAGSFFGVATRSDARHEQVLARAAGLALSEVVPGASPRVPDGSYHTQCGVRTEFCGRPAFAQLPGQAGAITFGPYVSLPAGAYEFSMLVGTARAAGGIGHEFAYDVVCDGATATLFSGRARPPRTAQPVVIAHRFTTTRPVEAVEIRVLLPADLGMVVSLPVIAAV
ncbi:MAG: class I SAM-dependent methyltransferase [Gluconacetobacter diazotrophicus]|nr:class I SAM-dependent methyltransferase [Gluconacetobacter diazotrophicus]